MAQGVVHDHAAGKDIDRLVPPRLVGFREWLLEPDGYLAGPFTGAPWPAGAITAVCEKFDHPAPAPHCECGVNAYHEPLSPGPGNLALGYADNADAWPTVVGAIVAWGRVHLTLGGFGAEHARPTVLVPRRHRPHGWDVALRKAAKRYEADIVPMHRLTIAAAEHGDTVPRELLVEHVSMVIDELSQIQEETREQGPASDSGPDDYRKFLTSLVSLHQDKGLRWPELWRLAARGFCQAALLWLDDEGPVSEDQIAFYVRGAIEDALKRRATGYPTGETYADAP